MPSFHSLSREKILPLPSVLLLHQHFHLQKFHLLDFLSFVHTLSPYCVIKPIFTCSPSTLLYSLHPSHQQSSYVYHSLHTIFSQPNKIYLLHYPKLTKHMSTSSWPPYWFASCLNQTFSTNLRHQILFKHYSQHPFHHCFLFLSLQKYFILSPLISSFLTFPAFQSYLPNPFCITPRVCIDINLTFNC